MWQVQTYSLHLKLINLEVQGTAIGIMNMKWRQLDKRDQAACYRD